MEFACEITGKTKLVGVIGNPLSHSISPQLHNTISKNLGIDAVYIPFLVEKGKLKEAIDGLKAINVLGFNITIPYKNDALKYIDDVSREASLIGAINTVKNINGKLYGYNTDVQGFIRSFKEESKMDLDGKTIMILGAGGAARAIAVGLAFERVSRICIINRTIKKAEDIAKLINENISSIVEYYETGDNVCKEILKLGDIIINTTPLGMFPDIHETPIRFPYAFSSNQVLYDVIYNPAKTIFLKEGEKQGAKVINGLGMLIYQGIEAYEIWFGTKVPNDIIKGLFEAFSSFK